MLITTLTFTNYIVGQSELLTTAESSQYTATSTYDAVMSFISNLDEQHAHMKLMTIATSTEGRE